MLEPESIAWLIYCILFGLMSIVLLAQSICYKYMIPFTIFTIALVCSHLYITVTPYYTEPDIAWRDQEPVINQIPIASFFIFAGIIHWQFTYLNFINTVYNNYKRWGTLHPVIISDIKPDDTMSEKSNSTSRSDLGEAEYTEILLSPPTTPPVLFNKQTLWLYIGILIVYVFVEFAFLICILAVNDPQTIAFSSAICITIMSITALSNFIAIVYTCIKCQSKEIVSTLEQIRKNLMSLIVMAFLWLVVMTNIAILSWFACFDVAAKPLSTTNWIILKAFIIYFPLFLFLLCCIFRCKNLNLSSTKIYTNKS